jgi:tRNA pseudouridine synthase 10
MLGPGRPFIVEISNARVIPSSAEIGKLERDINSLKEGWVKVRELRQVGIDACAIMREGESEKQKEYAAVVWLSRPVTEADFECLSSFKELELQQKTPVRVLHRRSPLTRPRTIHWMRCTEIKGTQNYFVLFLCTQAGTYIKEFVHGDLGRTFPNVGSILGCEADILQLDVMDVKMDFHSLSAQSEGVCFLENRRLLQ